MGTDLEAKTETSASLGAGSPPIIIATGLEDYGSADFGGHGDLPPILPPSLHRFPSGRPPRPNSNGFSIPALPVYKEKFLGENAIKFGVMGVAIGMGLGYVVNTLGDVEGRSLTYVRQAGSYILFTLFSGAFGAAIGKIIDRY